MNLTTKLWESLKAFQGAHTERSRCGVSIISRACSFGKETLNDLYETVLYRRTICYMLYVYAYTYILYMYVMYILYIYILYIHTYIHTCIHTYTHTHIHVCVCVCEWICTCEHMLHKHRHTWYILLTCVLTPEHRYACLYGHLIPRPSVGVSSIISIHKLLLSMYYMRVLLCHLSLFFFSPWTNHKA